MKLNKYKSESDISQLTETFDKNDQEMKKSESKPGNNLPTKNLNEKLDDPDCDCRDYTYNQPIEYRKQQSEPNIVDGVDLTHGKDPRTYIVYRNGFRNNLMLYSRKKTKGVLLGSIDGLITGCSNGAKWCGAGGWIVGGVGTLLGFTLGGITGFCAGAVYGLITNEDEVTSYWRHYRETFSIGDNSGQHGTWS